jgi:hypothetical protein
MPTTYTPPADRPAPDTATNVTKALSYHPDIVLVSFPTNDAAADYTLAETMTNLRLIYHEVLSAGKICYITTSQPRTSLATSQQQLLKRMRDSVLAEFPVYSLNFYNSIVAADSLSINPVYNFDGTHVNNGGHQQLFQVVMNANILAGAGTAPLALTLLDFSATAADRHVVLDWRMTAERTPASFVVQRSQDGVNFVDRWQKTEAPAAADPSTWSWTDSTPLSGNSYYRLRYTADNVTAYSATVDVNLGPAGWGITRLFASAGGTVVNAEIATPSAKTGTLSVLTTRGQLIYRQVLGLSPPSVMISIPACGWASGEYFLRLVTDQGDIATRAFLKF